MASTTSTPYTCLAIAEWRPDGFSGRERNLGILSEKPSYAHLSANFKFENGPYAAIHLELAPSTVSDEHDYNFPDQTISIVISAGNIQSISQDLPGWEYMPNYVSAEYKKHEARMHKQGIFNSQLKQAVRLDLTLKRTPVVLMPRHARSLAHPQDMTRVQALKSLSRMTSFVLFFVRSDRMINDLRQFRAESRTLSFDGSPAAVFDNLTHFSFSGPDEAHWSRYRVQQHTIAPLGQKRSLQDNHGNSRANEGSHNVKRTKHGSTPAYGSGLPWLRQSEPPIPNPHFGQAVSQPLFPSGTATLQNTQAKPSAVPNAHSKAESAPKIFNRSPARFESARASLLRHRASSVADHATRRGTQVPTSATTEPFVTSTMKLQTNSDPVRSSSNNQKPPTAASALISNSRMASSASPLYKFPTHVTWKPGALGPSMEELGSILAKAAGYNHEVMAHIELSSDLSNTCAAIHLVTSLAAISDKGSDTSKRESISLVISMDNIEVFEYSGGSRVGRVVIKMKSLPLVVMPRYPRLLLNDQELAYVQALKSLSRSLTITLYYIKDISNDAGVCAFRDAFQCYKGGAFAPPSDTATQCVFSGPEDERWNQYQVKTNGINDSEQAPTAPKKKKSHPPRRRHRPEKEEDGNDPKRTEKGGFANGSSAMVSPVKAEPVLPNHTSFCPVLHSSSAASSFPVTAAGTQAQPMPASSQQQIGPDEMVKRWRAYHDWTLLSSVNFSLDTMLDIQGILSSGLRAARAGDATTFAGKMADLFMLVDENKDEHQG